MRHIDRKFGLVYRSVVWLVVTTLVVSLLMPPRAAFAQIRPATILNLPQPGTMVPATSAYNPAIIRGMTILPDQPLEFDFIVDTGDDHLSGEDLSAESTKLIKYFLAALTVPEDQMWVNLSPYEKNRIIPDDFGHTQMGRDLLAQDYLLKQLSASLMYPEDELGGEFWRRVHQRAQQEYGTTDIPMNTFNKIWIVPERADVVVRDQSVYVVNTHLKVMLEEDYLALSINRNSTRHGLGDVKVQDLDIVTGVTAEVVRDVLIPEIEREINHGRTFANLRQIYHSMILATWYKKNLKASLLGQYYVNQSKTDGVEINDPAINQKIYEQYVRSFKKGVYDYIREDEDPVTKQVTPRKYFSGGVDHTTLDLAMKTVDPSAFTDAVNLDGTNVRVRTRLGDAAGVAGRLLDAEIDKRGTDRVRQRLPRILQPWLLFYRMFLGKSVTLRGLEHMPSTGSFIMAGNHLGNGLDGLLLVTEIYLTSGQLPTFVVRSQQNSLGPLSQKLLFWITNWMENHGIILTMQKKYGITGLRKMLQTLQERQAILGIYPGSDSWEDLSQIDADDFLSDVGRWRPGFVRIAKQFGIPILPFRESGDFPSRMIVSFAPPVYPEDKSPAQILDEVKQGVLAAEAASDAAMTTAELDFPTADNPYGAEFRVTRDYQMIDMRYQISDNFDTDNGAPKTVLLIGAGRGFTAAEMALQYPHLSITAVNKEAGLYRPDMIREKFRSIAGDAEMAEALGRIRPVLMDLNADDDLSRVLGGQRYDYIILETSTQMYFRDKIGIMIDLYNDYLSQGGVTAFYLEDIYLPQEQELPGLTNGEKQDASLRVIEQLLLLAFAGKAVSEPVNDAAFEDPAYMYKLRKQSDRPVEVPLRLLRSQRKDIAKVPGLFFYESVYEATDAAMVSEIRSAQTGRFVETEATREFRAKMKKLRNQTIPKSQTEIAAEHGVTPAVVQRVLKEYKIRSKGIVTQKMQRFTPSVRKDYQDEISINGRFMPVYFVRTHRHTFVFDEDNELETIYYRNDPKRVMSWKWIRDDAGEPIGLLVGGTQAKGVPLGVENRHLGDSSARRKISGWIEAAIVGGAGANNQAKYVQAGDSVIQVMSPAIEIGQTVDVKYEDGWPVVVRTADGSDYIIKAARDQNGQVIQSAVQFAFDDINQVFAIENVDVRGRQENFQSFGPDRQQKLPKGEGFATMAFEDGTMILVDQFERQRLNVYGKPVVNQHGAIVALALRGNADDLLQTHQFTVYRDLTTFRAQFSTLSRLANQLDDFNGIITGKVLDREGNIMLNKKLLRLERRNQKAPVDILWLSDLGVYVVDVLTDDSKPAQVFDMQSGRRVEDVRRMTELNSYLKTLDLDWYMDLESKRVRVDSYRYLSRIGSVRVFSTKLKDMGRVMNERVGFPVEQTLKEGYQLQEGDVVRSIESSRLGRVYGRPNVRTDKGIINVAVVRFQGLADYEFYTDDQAVDKVVLVATKDSSRSEFFRNWWRSQTNMKLAFDDEDWVRQNDVDSAMKGGDDIDALLREKDKLRKRVARLKNPDGSVTGLIRYNQMRALELEIDRINERIKFVRDGRVETNASSDAAMTAVLEEDIADLFRLNGQRIVMTTLRSSWYAILRAELEYIRENRHNPNLQPRRWTSQLTTTEEVSREKDKWGVLNRMGLLRIFYSSDRGQYSYAIPEWIFEGLRQDPRSLQEIIERNIPHLDLALGLFSTEYAAVSDALKSIENDHGGTLDQDIFRLGDPAMLTPSLEDVLAKRERAKNKLLAIDEEYRHRHKEHIELYENRDPMEDEIKADLKILDPETFDFALDPDLPQGFSSQFHHALMKISDDVFVLHAHLKAKFNREYDPSGQGSLGEKGGGGLFIVFERDADRFSIRHIFISPDLGNYVLPAISLNTLADDKGEDQDFWQRMYQALERSATRFINTDVKSQIERAVSANKVRHYLGQSIFGSGKNRLFEFIPKRVAVTQDEDGIIVDRERGIYYELIHSIDQIDADEAMISSLDEHRLIMDKRSLDRLKGNYNISDRSSMFAMFQPEYIEMLHRLAKAKEYALLVNVIENEDDYDSFIVEQSLLVLAEHAEHLDQEIVQLIVGKVRAFLKDIRTPVQKVELALAAIRAVNSSDVVRSLEGQLLDIVTDKNRVHALRVAAARMMIKYGVNRGVRLLIEHMLSTHHVQSPRFIKTGKTLETALGLIDKRLLMVANGQARINAIKSVMDFLELSPESIVIGYVRSKDADAGVKTLIENTFPGVETMSMSSTKTYDEDAFVRIEFKDEGSDVSQKPLKGWLNLESVKGRVAYVSDQVVSSLRTEMNIGDRPVIVVGSPGTLETGPIMRGFKELIDGIEDNAKKPLLIMGFRQPSDESRLSVYKDQYVVRQRTQADKDAGRPYEDLSDADILTVTSVGELGTLYALARNNGVGIIGHDRNIMELAMQGIAFMNMPGGWNLNKKVLDTFVAGQAVQTYSDTKLAKILQDDALRQEMAARALEIGQSIEREMRQEVNNLGILLGLFALESITEDLDFAMLTKPEDTLESENKGGIDLNPSALELNVEGDFIELNLPSTAPAVNLEQINGFVPIIINISPAPSLPMLLGLIDQEGPTEVGRVPQLDPMALRLDQLGGAIG